MMRILLFLFFGASALFAQQDIFWEAPRLFSPGQGNFPVTAYNGDLGILVWQEPQRQPALGGGTINIALAVKTPGQNWENRGVIGGPYHFFGTEPSIISAVVDSQNRILIAAAASATHVEILISEDYGITFERHTVDSGTETSLAPRIFVNSDGSYLLFVTRGREISLSIYYAHSTDGRSWSPFQPFVTEPEMQLNFLPSHASFQGREYVVFQSFIITPGITPTFQLFLKTSDDAGRTWGPSRRFTTFRDTFLGTTSSPDFFDNQRPHLSVQENSLFLVWERRYRTGLPQIYAVHLNPDGTPRGIPEMVSTANAFSNNPIAFSYRGETRILWFDNRRGIDRIFLAQRAGFRWEEAELPGDVGGEASFGRPVVDDDGLFIFWQSSARGSTRIYSLSPKTSVDAPRITGLNFTPGRRTRGDRVHLSWNVPPDFLGIQGFSWVWSRDPTVEPPSTVLIYNTTGLPQAMELEALEDGPWYFSVMARDHAGNWSPPARLMYYRDTTPPGLPVIIPPDIDEHGYLVSNTFHINWEAPPDPDIEGFSWELDFLASTAGFRGMDNIEFLAVAEEIFSERTAALPRIMGRGTSVFYYNQDDGVWRFSVRAIDEAGNVGPQAVFFFRTNKYIPRTFVTLVDAVQDRQGVLTINLIGRGFSRGGNVDRIFLQSGAYVREFFLARGDYTIVSDREIRGIQAEHIEEGLFRIGVHHPLRGLYLTGPVVAVRETGTVKFGDFSASWRPSWLIANERRFSFNMGAFIIVSILLLCALGLIVTIRGIGETIVESAAIRLDAAALLTGDLMPSEKKKHMTRIKKRGAGLRLKLASFTIVLVLLVVTMVSVPLYVMMTQTQRETLVQGLYDRSRVLLEGLASSSRAHLPLQSVLELGLLPAQMLSVPEARYITITGTNPASIFNDHVWATNDPNILEKIDTSVLQPGISRITDVISPRLQELAYELNERARSEVGDISESIVALTREGIELAPRLDAVSQRRLEDIQVQVLALQTRVNERLAEISGVIMSEPEFSPENFVVSEDRRYIFFKPIMYRLGAEDVFFRGLVRLEVSVDSILEEIAEGQLNLIRVILFVAFIAVIIGAIGALLLSTIIISPIKKLVRHVEIIRDTEDKAKLEGLDIKIKSKDELAILGNTINEMTVGLAKAAAAAEDLSIGKEIQKKFIPLELDREGNKLSYGAKDTKHLNFFGYYEGAKGVSGDYFDYHDLDGRYYAIIKCDVAGKGIPAALIMIQVATMFLGHFRRWKPDQKGMRIEDLVYQINDFIEALGFKGRFAAFTLCLYDSETGVVRFCNAGDNVVHFFDASEKRVKAVNLPETPATGVLPNALVQSKGGYTVQSLTLDPGDILLLYTDGIEEAKRKFRNAAFAEIICEEGEKDTPHGNHTVGQADEELGPDRVENIINAVMNKQVYNLHKWHNPEGNEKTLQFDFSSCEGSVEDVIMAMISVEKMFRCFKDTKATADDRVLVEKSVDRFLKKYFVQYREYCSFTRENPGNEAYMYYTNVKEDEQYDDLTLLGIKRK